MRASRLAFAITCVGIGAAAACSSYSDGPSGAPPPSPEAGRADDASSNVQDASSDATVGPTDDGLYLACPPTSTGSTFVDSAVTTTIVKRGPGFDYPFGIVTDSQFIYWVSQFADQSDATVEAYNGGGKARIHRVSKTAVNAEPADTILVDGAGEHTVALALDGAYVYWASFIAADSRIQILRIRRDCAAPCTPEMYLEAGGVNRSIGQMRRGSPGLVFAMSDEGQVFAIDTVKKSIVTASQTTASYPGLAVMGESAFVSWLDEPNVLKVTTTSIVEHGKFPPPDGGARGSYQLATDCTRLFAWRPDRDLWAADATQPSSFAKYATVGQLNVYDMVADRDYVYLASLDGLGVRAVSIAARQVVREFEGSYFRIWADDTGLYAGDHDRNLPGALYRFRD